MRPSSSRCVKYWTASRNHGSKVSNTDGKSIDSACSDAHWPIRTGRGSATMASKSVPMRRGTATSTGCAVSRQSRVTRMTWRATASHTASHRLSFEPQW
ncbi:MAG: hypothetical protein IPK07_12740 [Deltaproteobacteria bacterium]|nr:hypothetical protein [Deltaproteobacteria bacterium]